MSSVDVIVPCYRYGRFLSECVDSVLKQQVAKLRVLIIDDASPDNTSEVATALCEKDSRVSLIRHRENRGHIATYNEGISWLESDYMLLLSADDYLLEGALARAIDLMEERPDVGFTFGNVLELGPAGIRKESVGVPGVNSDSDREVLEGWRFLEFSGSHNVVPTPTAIVRTRLLREVGGYRPELPHTGDMELWFRLAAHAKVGVLGAYQAVYRRHSNNMSLAYFHSNRLPDLKERKAALDSFFDVYSARLPARVRLREKAMRALGRDAIGYASSAFNDGDLGACSQLEDFAIEVCPRLARNRAWWLLRAKRALGVRNWHALRPAVTGVRSFLSSGRHRAG